MNNPDEQYNRLHDHMSAIARERDWLQSEVNRLTDELHLAHEALKREFVHQGITEAVTSEVEHDKKICGNCSAVIRWRGGWPIADTTYRSQP